MEPLLTIQDLTVTTSGKTVLENVSLSLASSEIHLLMGPNGSGKSSLCNTLMGHPAYTITHGSVQFDGKDLLKMRTDERARQGLFLAFQYPREIPGVSLASVLRTARHAQKQGFDRKHFIQDVKAQLSMMKLSEEFAKRALNENASGGEKKRLEMVQLGILAPKLAVLDEIDSGLDVDALKIIATTIQQYAKERGMAFLIITHNPRLLHYIEPDRVHILVKGRVRESGDSGLAERIEKQGFKIFEK